MCNNVLIRVVYFIKVYLKIYYMYVYVVCRLRSKISDIYILLFVFHDKVTNYILISNVLRSLINVIIFLCDVTVHFNRVLSFLAFKRIVK